MAEYIQRSYIRKMAMLEMAYTMETETDAAVVLRMIEDAPTADVAPVVYGRWIRPHWRNDNYCYDCSECGGEAMHRDYQWDKHGIYPICPNCGAKMDGGVDNEID